MRAVLTSAILGAVALLVAWLLRFIFAFRKQRAFYRNVPCPPHDYWWGHLKLMGEIIAQLPPKFHIQQVIVYIGQKYQLPSVFYLDLWPFACPMMVCADPAVAAQITTVKSLPKHPISHAFIEPLVGKPSIVLAEGAEWKYIRSIVMPSFAPSYLATLTPILAKHIERFVDKLTAFAETGEQFKLQPHTMSLTFDVICEVVMGTDHKSQMQYDALAYHFGKAAVYAGAMTSSFQWILTAIPRWWHASQQSKIVTAMIKQRHAQDASTKKGPRAALDLFIQAHREHYPDVTSSDLDPAFLSLALCNVKSLLLGGHDTTSATLTYTLALLSTHPTALSRVRTEHQRVFNNSASFASIAAQINAKPSLLSDSSLPYTTACIKETLRIFSPASTGRVSSSPASDGITSTTGAGVTQHLPLLPNHQLWILHLRMHHDPATFPSPAAYIPERFLPDLSPFGPEPIPPHAYRPFERGPRACIGVELAMMEMKMALIAVFCSASDLELVVDYPPDAPRAPEGSGLGGPDGRWWQVIEFAAKPVLGMPVRVKRRRTTGREKEGEREGEGE